MKALWSQTRHLFQPLLYQVVSVVPRVTREVLHRRQAVFASQRLSKLEKRKLLGASSASVHLSFETAANDFVSDFLCTQGWSLKKMLRIFQKGGSHGVKKS